MTAHNVEELLTTGAAARYLGVSPRTVRRYVQGGRIAGTQNILTKRWLINRTDLQAFAAKHGVKLQT